LEIKTDNNYKSNKETKKKKMNTKKMNTESKKTIKEASANNQKDGKMISMLIN